MPDETLTIDQLKEAVYPLFQLLNDPSPGVIHYHIAVAQQMDKLVDLWGDRFTPPVSTSPETFEGLVGRWVPSAPNLPLKVMRVGDETVLINDEDTIVMSKTDAGKRYQVILAHCECAGFMFRGTCRHLAAAKTARELYRAEQFPPKSKS